METVNDLQKLTANISTASQDEDDEPLECEVCAQCCKSPLSLHCRMLMTSGRTYQANLMPHAHGRVNRSRGVSRRCTNWREQFDRTGGVAKQWLQDSCRVVRLSRV